MRDLHPCILTAGELEATFLPEVGLLCASLRHRGDELLGRTGELDAYVRRGSTLGIPLLHPWANRLDGFHYEAAGVAVRLDRGSPLLHLDGNGLPIHGVPGAKLAWEILDQTTTTLVAQLSWDRADLLALFPYPHLLWAAVALDGGGLTLTTTLAPLEGAQVPVAFGYHPYLTLPGVAREQWRVELPAMRRLVLDARAIPTGAGEPFAGLDGPLDRAYDDGFDHVPERPTFAISGGERRIVVTFETGYTYAQVFAPPDKDYVALEPMTAPANALVSGTGLRVVDPGASFEASFRIAVASQ